MPFVDEVLKYSSLSIVGLEKNTGKTECLNYLLKRLPTDERTIAVSSIGIDGERVDQVTRTGKPEITLKKNIIYTTSERHYRNRRLLSELLEISDERTALGRLITARALTDGKIMLSGPSTTASLARWNTNVQQKFGVELCIIDGALSRLSLASPIVSQSMILTTGAALSIDINTLVRKTIFTIDLINIPLTESSNQQLLKQDKDQGVSMISLDGETVQLPDFSVFSPDISILSKTVENIKAIYLPGALTDRLLKKITESPELKGVELIVRDFTRIFVDPITYAKYIGNGGRISVLRKSKLIAICVNPVAPNGVILDSKKIREKITEKTKLPTYDIFENGHKA